MGWTKEGSQVGHGDNTSTWGSELGHGEREVELGWSDSGAEVNQPWGETQDLLNCSWGGDNGGGCLVNEDGGSLDSSPIPKHSPDWKEMDVGVREREGESGNTV